MKRWFTPIVVVGYMTVIPFWAGSQTVALPEQINTTFEELQPLVTLDGKRIYFSRKGDQRNIGDHNNADCWYSEKSPQGVWMEPIHCGMVINNFDDNSLVAIDFRKSWGLVKDGKGAGRFFELEFDGEYVKRTGELNWTDSLPNFHILDAHFLQETGIGVLSMRDKKDGNADLYLTKRSRYDSVWSVPVKIQGGINGPQDERYPHLSPDGKTLYFSSNSHGGFGGSDVFITRLNGEDATYWSSPKNMGRSINSALDETAPSLSVIDRMLFFVRTLPLKGSDLFSVNLESSLLPQTMTLVVIKADCRGQLVKSTIGGKTERMPQRDSIFNLVLNGKASSMLTFVEDQGKFYPSQVIRSLPTEEVLDYEPQAFMDAILSDSDYKIAELEIQKLQKEMLKTRTGLNEYGLLLDAQINNIVVPTTGVFENEGFKTDRTLLELEQKYEQFLDKSLTGKNVKEEEAGATSLSLEGREKRIANLKKQINNEGFMEEKEVVIQTEPLSFINFREKIKREVEIKLFPEVWEALVMDLKTEVQLEVKNEYESEAYRNLLKGEWLKDSIPQIWRIPQKDSDQILYKDALAGDLKRHLEPMVRATMLSLLKEEVTIYLKKILHLIALERIQNELVKDLKNLTSAQKNLEKKIFESLVQSASINTEQQDIPLPLDENEFLEYEWSFKAVPLVKHVYTEIPALNFLGNGVQLDHFARLELNRIVRLVQNNPEVVFEILVHSHGYMSYATAETLTNQRAKQIENYLSRTGVKPGRIKVIGVGKNYPKLANHNYENRRQNQRVEILIK